MNVLDAKSLFQMHRSLSLQKINVLEGLPQTDNMALSIDFFKQWTESKSLSVQTLKNYNQRLEVDSSATEPNLGNLDIRA